LLASSGEARPTDVARRLGVSHVTAIKKREGLATGRPYRGIFLTDEGRRLATRVRARHRLVVDVLRKAADCAERVLRNQRASVGSVGRVTSTAAITGTIIMLLLNLLLIAQTFGVPIPGLPAS
jgi:hypothetical protein